MPTLDELQSGFCTVVLGGSETDDGMLNQFVEAPAVARQRLAAYRRSVVGRWVDALEASFPVISALVGRPFLREAARQYALGHPSASGDLNEYGESFADFLDHYPFAAELPYLGDVARLEWQVQAVAMGPDSAPVSLDTLGRIAPADWPRLVLGIAPNHARIDSRWPVVDIWRRHQTESDDLPALDWRAGSRALVWREGVRPVVVGLSVAQAALFDALCAGTALGPALSQAAALQADINPGEFLNSLAQSGLLNSAQLP